MIYYIRNDIDDLVGFKYNDTNYYYVKNAQEDIIGILDSNNNVVARYEYDSWGNITSITDGNGNDISTNGSHISNINPFRYRSYYYDKETNLYYLNSRYYNPVWGRFINADGQMSGIGGDIGGYNLFVYCFNNPVNMTDSGGVWPSFGKIVAAVATVAVAVVAVTAVVASAGAVGVAAGVAAASIGATGTMVSAAITVGTIGTYAVAAGIGACALSNAGEMLTGTNLIRDVALNGNQEAYNVVQATLNIAGGVAIATGQINPGVTGNSAKPSKDAQVIHKVSTNGAPKSSIDKLYQGGAGGFQRTYYDYKGNVSLQIDFTTHTKPLTHTNPHLHVWDSKNRGSQINLWYLGR